MAESNESISTSDYQPRKTGLVLFGIMQILAGGICVLMVGLMGITMAMTSATGSGSSQQVDVVTMLPAMAIYGVAAVLFIWLGVGSILARRWARALMLLLSWGGLVGGIGGMAVMAFILPALNSGMAENVESYQPPSSFVSAFLFVFLFLFFILVPTVQIFFYGSKNVKATCEAIDKKTRWTDRRPLPILALSLMLWYSAFTVLMMGFYNWVELFFGIVLSGPAGAVVLLTKGVLLGALALYSYRLNIKAWWATLLLYLVWGLSVIVTLSRNPVVELYEKMGMIDEQLAMVEQSGLSQSGLIWMIIFFYIPVVAYLLYTKRFFTVEGEATT